MIKAVEEWLSALRSKLIDARRQPREFGALQSAILSIEGREQRVRLVDLSNAGAMVATRTPIEAGTYVRLQLLDREPLDGQVRWSRDGRIGISFDTPRAKGSGIRNDR